MITVLTSRSILLTSALFVFFDATYSMVIVEKKSDVIAASLVHDDESQLTFHSDNSLEEIWSSYKTQYKKSYSSLHEELSRQLIFVDNLEKIWKHNDEYARGLKSFTLGVNQFTDMSTEEFSLKMTGLKRRSNTTRNGGAATYMSPNVKFTLPDSVDWRDKGYVTPVKDQGPCGSCWTFSTTGTLEGQHFRQTGQLVSLSEQNIVDCVSQDGCGGGYEDDAYQYIIKNGGIDTEDSYPYDAQDGPCHFNPQSVGATMTGFTQVTPSGSEAKLMEAVATVGPISVNIDASHSSFQSYRSGIYNEPSCSSQDLDHAVLVVGYGTKNNQDYWIVKNSWATTWGDQGYIYMSRNNNNQCGIATDASYPLV